MNARKKTSKLAKTVAGQPLGVAPCSALLVGGENDGRRMPVEPLERIRLPLPPEKQKGIQMETEDYCIELLRTQNAEFAFYRSTSISMETALRRLFKYYTPNDQALRPEASK